jgi:hypothetical protein
MGIRMSDKWINYSHKLAQNQTTSWLVRSWSIFGARTSHKQTQIHKTHHGPNLGETTTFPLLVFFVPSHKVYTNVILSRDSEVGSPEVFKIGTLATLEAHNVLWKHSIEVRSEAKLYPSLRAFQRYVACHLNASKSGQFLTFSCQESNWQFDSRPFFAITYVLSTQISQANPFQTSTFQDLFNGIMKFSIKWFFSLVIAF